MKDWILAILGAIVGVALVGLILLAKVVYNLLLVVYEILKSIVRK